MSELQQIQHRIHSIRGKQVMLDRDLAELYGVETRSLKQAVKRNKERFPEDFILELNEKETHELVSQNVIPSKQYFGGAMPYAFTEQGVAMLSGVLKSKKAVKVNIQIMRAFVAMRRFLAQNENFLEKFHKIDQKLLEHDKRLEVIFSRIDSKLPPSTGIFFEGQAFDAHELVSRPIRSAKEEIVLIDNYVDESVLALLKKRSKGVKATVYTRKNQGHALDVKKFKEQYSNTEIKEFNKSHDRFMIIDRKEVYHIGASLKDLSKKWFAFSRLKISPELILQRL